MTTRQGIAQTLALTFIALFTLFLFAYPAHAQEETTVASVALSSRIPAKGHTDPGTIQQVSKTTVPPAAQSGTCEVDVTGANNESVHPNSDVIVDSTNSVTIHDVERVAGATNLPADGTLVLGETVTVWVRLGEDGLFSGGALVVDFSCTSPPPPTTTTTAPPQTTTTPTTVVKLGPPVSPVTRCVENPDTPALECGLPNTGARSGVDVIVGLVFLAVGIGALLFSWQWVLDRRRGE